MATSWVHAFVYALKVVTASLVVQGFVGLLLLTASGHQASDIADFSGAQIWGFALFTTAALTLARRLQPTAPRWKAVTVDSSLYTGCVLFYTIGWYALASAGLADAVDLGFVFLIVGLFTLQIPTAMITSSLAHRRLTTT